MSHTFTFPSRPKKNKDELNTFKISIQHIVVELRWTDIWKNNIEKGWKKSRKRKIILQTAIWTDGHVHNKNNTSREKLILASVFSTSPIYTIHYLNKKTSFTPSLHDTNWLNRWQLSFYLMEQSFLLQFVLKEHI